MSKKSLLFSIIAVMLSCVLVGCDSSCTDTKSYGVNSFTKDAGNTCIKKLAGATCYGNSSKEDIAKIIAKVQKYEFVFNKEECRDLNEKDENGNNKPVKCPDFIPESFKLTKLTGCEIYTLTDPDHYKCGVSCPQIFFETDNDYFKTVSYSNSESAKDSNIELNSKSVDGKVDFYYMDNYADFYWSEKAEDGTESRKGIIIWMEIVDSNIVEEEPVPEEDEE